MASSRNCAFAALRSMKSWLNRPRKSTTLLELMQHVLGSYAYTAMADLLIKTKGDRHSTEVMDLKSRRLVVCTESDKNDKMFVSRAKALSGQDRITARRMHKDSAEFQQSHTLILQTNHLPQISDSGKGIWRRILVVPLTASLSAGEEDTHLRDKLKADDRGILNWLLEGFRKYKWYGLKKDLPSAVVAATDAYRYADNPAAAFVKARCVVTKQGTMTSADLYAAYELWAKRKGDHPVEKNAFGRGLSDLGVRSSRSAHQRCWHLRLKRPKK